MFHVEYLLIAESLKRIFISSLHGDPLQSFMIAWMERFSICHHSHSRIFEHLEISPLTGKKLVCFLPTLALLTLGQLGELFLLLAFRVVSNCDWIFELSIREAPNWTKIFALFLLFHFVSSHPHISLSVAMHVSFFRLTLGLWCSLARKYVVLLYPNACILALKMLLVL